MSASVKEALVESLHGSLSPEAGVRKAAEERLKALEVTEQYPLILMEIVLAQGEGVLSPPLRQLASVVLRQYVDNHWTSIAERYVNLTLMILMMASQNACTLLLTIYHSADLYPLSPVIRLRRRCENWLRWDWPTLKAKFVIQLLLSFRL